MNVPVTSGGFGLEWLPSSMWGNLFSKGLGKPMFPAGASEKVTSFSLVGVHAWLNKIMAASNSNHTAQFPHVHLFSAHQHCAG